MKLKIVIFNLLLLSLSHTLYAQENPVKLMFGQAMEAYSAHNYQQAIIILEKINQIYPNFAPTYNYLGMCYKESGIKPNDIKWLYEKAIELDPHYADAYDNLAKLYYAETNFDKAEEYELKAIEINPNFSTAHLTLGWVYLLGKSDSEKAIEHFIKVLSQNNDIPYAQFGLGVAYHMEHQSFRVLEMITKLRQANREDLAQQLEGVIRAGKYEGNGIPGSPLIAQAKNPAEVKEENLTFSDNEKMKKMPVRLGSTEESPADATSKIENSPQERLRALRRRGMEKQGIAR